MITSEILSLSGIVAILNSALVRCAEDWLWVICCCDCVLLKLILFGDKLSDLLFVASRIGVIASLTAVCTFVWSFFG